MFCGGRRGNPDRSGTDQAVRRRVLLISEWADKNWQQVDFPASIREHVKPAKLDDDRRRILRGAQSNGTTAIGAVVAMATRKRRRSRSASAWRDGRGYSIEKPIQALDKAASN